MIECLFVGIGGFVGSILRYLIGLLSVEAAGGFPIKTFCINILGAFVLGVVSESARLYPALPSHLVLMLQVGLCGGFTTFSTFSGEALGLLTNGRQGTAIFYMAASMLLGLCAVFAGQMVARLR